MASEILVGSYTTERRKTSWNWLFKNHLVIKVPKSLKISLSSGGEGNFLGKRTINVVCFDINNPLSIGEWVWNKWREEETKWIREWVKSLPEFKELQKEIESLR